MSLQIIKIIAEKNLKLKLRNYQTYIYSFGFPLLFTIIFYIVFKPMIVSIDGNLSVFDLATSGMLIYTASFGTINAANSLTFEKERLTLRRLDTTPVGRANIFLGTLLSESFFLIIQLITMFFISYGILGAKWYEKNLILLFVGFLIVLLFGLSTLGIGIIISAIAKSASAAIGFSMMYVMPILFMSGAMIPLESPIVYFCPPFWANQLYQQVVILGDNLLLGSMKVNSVNILDAEYSMFPLWGTILVIILILVSTIYLGIKLFQRKT